MTERHLLNSWKEIAAHLGRGVRTVQRWENQLGLPVHRPAGKDHSAVLAFSTELDEWLTRRPRPHGVNREPSEVDVQTVMNQALLAKADTLLQKCEKLLERNDELCRNFSKIVEILNQEQSKPRKNSSRSAEIGAA
jgi:phage terminase Nu1 subunit (DNA packaging protein)